MEISSQPPDTLKPPPRLAIVVDDDRLVLQIAERVLRRMGLDVLAVSQSYGLMNRIATHRPWLVLLDVNMPGLDGPTIVTLIRSDPEIAGSKIVLYSALDPHTLARKAQECGADGYISKALGLIHFEKAISRWVSR